MAAKKVKKYRALTGLTFPASAAAVKKRKAGEELEPDEWARAEAEDTISDIPAESIDWLLEAGKIEAVK